jgi:DNA polymerase
MRRDEVYICNILKCRPPENRNPEPDEIASCQPFLIRQIQSVKPKVVCALGTFGAQTLLQTREPISKLRGQLIEFRGAKLMATFHPAYLLRNPHEKRKVWEDMQKIRDYLKSL